MCRTSPCYARVGRLAEGIHPADSKGSGGAGRSEEKKQKDLLGVAEALSAKQDGLIAVFRLHKEILMGGDED